MDHRAPQVVLGVGPVTANDVAVAVDVGAWRDGSLLHGDQPLDHFENGARSIGAAYGPVVEGFPRVFGQTVVSRTPTRSRQQVPVVGGRRNEGQDLPGRRLDGHDGAPFALHQLLGIALQVGVERQGHIRTRHRQRVHVRQRVSHVVSDVHEVVANARRATQVGLKLGFHSGFALVVPEPVTGIAVHVFAVHLAVLADDLARDAVNVFAHGLGADGQSGIPPEL